MKALALVLGIAVLASVASGGASGSAASQAVTPGMQSVIVTLREQATLVGISAPTRAARREKVVRALQRKANLTQAGLRTLLEIARRQGYVAEFTPFWAFNGFAVTATPELVARLARRPEVLKITPNAAIQGLPEEAVASTPEANIALVGAPDLWALGFTGAGVVVASMDSGVDVSHPDLAAQWRGGTNSWFDPNGQHPTTPTDLSGHGTQTTGVIVGRDAGGTAVGVAPDAQWIAVKIFDDSGGSTVARIHEGFQWLLDPDGNPATPDAPHVVNNSWTFGSPGCNFEFQLDLQALRAAEIVPVFAAGNYGPQGSTSRSPANNPEALAVGATTNADNIWPASARGPSSCADTDTTYPEVVAPGASIRSTGLSGSYVSSSGTSLAAPHVTGALALLLDAQGAATAAELEAALESTGVDLGSTGADDTYGYGRLDILAAYNWLGSAPPDFTLAASPSTASTAQGSSVSYTVSVSPQAGFTGDVALSLSGLPADASASFAPTVVPGGSGSSQLIVSTSTSTPAGSYPLTITGTSDALSHAALVTLVVTPPADFTLSASPASASTAQGGGVGYTVSIGSLNGFSGDVTLSLSGLPAGAGASFNPEAVVGGEGSSQLSVTTAATTPTGSYPLTITGTSGALSHATLVTLVVTSPADFTLSASPASASAAQGAGVIYTVSVGSLNGFSGDVALSLNGLPAGAGASFNPAAVVGGAGSSQLSVTTAATTPTGSYPLTITGTSGSLLHTASVTLVVSPAQQVTFPSSTTIVTGTYGSGGASSLAVDDSAYYSINSTTKGKRTTAWYGAMTAVPNTLTSLRVTYKGKNSRICTQVVAIRNWTSSSWIDLDSRSVGTDEVLIADLAPGGTPADYVSRNSGNGEIRVRIRCQTSAGSFVSSGNLLKVVYTLP